MRPTISYTVTVEAGANDIVVTANATTETLTIAAGDYRGWGTDALGTPHTDTLAYALQTALLTHSQLGSVAVSYDYSDPAGSPRLKVEIGDALDPADEIVWTSGASTMPARDLGWDPAADAALSSTVYALHNAAGYWCPGQVGAGVVGVERNPMHVGSLSRPDFDFSAASYSSRYWGAVASDALTYPYVDAAYVLRYRANDAVFAARAKRDIDDPNNVFETMVAAAASGLPLRFHSEDGTTVDLGDGDGAYINARLPLPHVLQGLITATAGLGAYTVAFTLEITT